MGEGRWCFLGGVSCGASLLVFVSCSAAVFEFGEFSTQLGACVVGECFAGFVDVDVQVGADGVDACGPCGGLFCEAVAEVLFAVDRVSSFVSWA